MRKSGRASIVWDIHVPHDHSISYTNINSIFSQISGMETHLVMLTFAILHDRLYSFAVKGRDKDVGYFVMP